MGSIGPSGQCKVPSDCFLNGTSAVIKKCYASNIFVHRTDFCACNPWYGWTGEDCDVPSFQLWYFRLMNSFLAMWAVLIFLFGLYLEAKLSLNGKMCSALSLTCLIGLMSSAAYFLHNFLPIPALFDPSYFELMYIKTATGIIEEVTHTNGLLAVKCLGYAVNFLFFMGIQVSFTWINLATSAKLLAKQDRWRLQIFKAVVTLLMVAYLGAFAITNYLDYYYPAYIMAPVAGGLLCLTYMISGYYFRKAVLRNTVQKNENISNALKIIIKSIVINLVCLGIIAALNIVFYFIVQDFNIRMLPGDFNLVLLTRDISKIAASVLLTHTFAYINGTATRIIKYTAMGKSKISGANTFSRLYNSATYHISRTN